MSGATFHFDKLYSYLLPPRLEGRVFVGSMVLVPFGRGSRPRMAVVLAEEETGETGRLKTVFDAAPEEARLTPDLLHLVRFLRERTFCTWYDAVKAVIPYGAQYRPAVQDGVPVLQKQVTQTTELQYRLAGPLPEKPTEKQRAAAAALQDGPLTLAELEERGVSRAVAERLVSKGTLEKGRVDKTVDLYSGIERSEEPIVLSEEQQRAYDALVCHLDGRPHAALLHGVTSSGKTLVFLKLIQTALERGKTALVLVPEISLTPQMIRRLKAVFGERVAVQHSALSHTERLLQWQMIQKGGADIVVGTRSAVFAPVKNLGLIVIDEEHEHTYRSESSPRYLAHDVASRRAADSGALLLLCSATPRMESYQAALSGRYQLVELTHRYGGQALPTVELVDMRAEMQAGNASDISRALGRAIHDTIRRGEQVILLLNRRGYRTVALCSECGEAVKCGSCSVPMVYHKNGDKLLCHYCGRTIAPPPAVCPSCGAPLRYTGFGTQRVEEELQQLLPSARILRMDQDSTSRKDSHDRMLAQFARHEYDIMLGTQMVAKGLDFERVTLVGVLGIDSLLFSAGFRANENVFSLVTQVIGRGGRAQSPGHAIIQTVEPDHVVLNLAARQDYQAFFRQEIGFRRLCLYPPFCTLCVLGFSGEKEPEVLAAAGRFARLLGQEAAKVPGLPLRVLGPAPMNVVMVNDRYRYKLTVKCRNDRAFRALLARVLDLYSKEGLPARATVAVDMNSDGDL